jgi:hypothetical protein
MRVSVGIPAPDTNISICNTKNEDKMISLSVNTYEIFDADECDDNIDEIFGKIFKYNVNEEKIEIGNFGLNYIVYDDNCSLLDIFDCLDDDLAWFMSFIDSYGIRGEIVDDLFHGESPWGSNYLIPKTLTIYPEFRGNKYAIDALRLIFKHFSRSAGYILMKPHPLLDSDDSNKDTNEKIKNGIKALTKYYLAYFNFKKIVLPDNSIVLIHNTNFKLDK